MFYEHLYHDETKNQNNDMRISSITIVDIDVTNVVVFDVIRALIRVALNQNRNAVFIRSTAFCFILTVAIYSSFLCTPSISRLFSVIAL